MILVNDHIAMPLGATGVPSRARLKAVIEEVVDVLSRFMGLKMGGERMTLPISFKAIALATGAAVVLAVMTLLMQGARCVLAG